MSDIKKEESRKPHPEDASIRDQLGGLYTAPSEPWQDKPSANAHEAVARAEAAIGEIEEMLRESTPPTTQRSAELSAQGKSSPSRQR